MAFRSIFSRTLLGNYGKAIREAPREIIFNRQLLLTTAFYASSAIPATWDQGSSSVVPSLQGFQDHFGISSGTDAGQIRNFISLVYIGYALGAALSFFLNDRVGRLWSFRIYSAVYAVGQIIATTAPNVSALYAARVVSGIGIGALTVVGPMAIAEIAPAEIRGVLGAWFVLGMAIALFSSVFCTLGVLLHVSASRLQYQIAWFSPCIVMAVCVLASFMLCESPRWLFVVQQRDRAVATLIRLRGLPADHPRVRREIEEIEASIDREAAGSGTGARQATPPLKSIVKEMFTVPSNLRRLQQCLVSFALAQLSGANSITSYFVPILDIIGVGSSDNAAKSMFLSGMYGVSKFFFAIIASFFFIDALGRRKSLFVGITIQMLTHLYVGVYIKYVQQDEEAMPKAASEGALAMLFLHAFGYVVGLLILPYVFGGELWPNRIRSFGGALSQTFHWLFIYGFSAGVPSLLEKTNNWGAFIFFAGCCFLALIYVYLIVPEVSGLSVEQIEEVFKGPWYDAHRRARRPKRSLDGDLEIVVSDASEEEAGDGKVHVQCKE